MIEQEIQISKDKDKVDFPHRHPSKVTNDLLEEMSFEEVQEWFELEGKIDNLHLGS